MIDQVEDLAKVKKNYPNHFAFRPLTYATCALKLTRALIVDDRG